MKNYTQLSKSERQELSDKGYNLRAIAQMLRRSPTTVSYELNKKGDRNGHLWCV